LTEIIINSAFEVHKVLGAGFLEKVYQNALIEELKLRYLKAESQRAIRVSYKDINVGEYFADIVVEDVIIIEIKALDKLNDIHELQLKNYLNATGMEVGLLINFGKSVEIKRKYVHNSEA
jgi:GxxExxY protein